MATSVVADKLRLFDLFTQILTAAKRSGPASPHRQSNQGAALVQEALDTWTRMDESAEARWAVLADNVKLMQDSGRARVDELEANLRLLLAGAVDEVSAPYSRCRS